MVMLKSTTLNGCWQIVWPDATDFWEFPRQQDETGYSSAMNDKVPGEGFSNFNEADIQKILHFHSAQLIEQKLQQITALSELQYERRIWCCCAKPQLATSALNNYHQMADNSVISFKLTSLWTCACNLNMKWIRSWHNTRMCTEVGKTKITSFITRSCVLLSAIFSYNTRSLWQLSARNTATPTKTDKIVLCLLIIHTVSCFRCLQFLLSSPNS